jgi:hypothetical protein
MRQRHARRRHLHLLRIGERGPSGSVKYLRALAVKTHLANESGNVRVAAAERCLRPEPDGRSARYLRHVQMTRA